MARKMLKMPIFNIALCWWSSLQGLKEKQMEIRTIHNKKEYKAALDEIEQLWTAPAKSAEADRLDVLTLLVEHYEKAHFPITDPDPIPHAPLDA